MISTALQPPELSKYELLEEIGHGGMATVYRARDVRLDRDVAVKLLHKHLRDSAEVRTRFASEARAVAKLRHPNIVEVFDVSDEDDEERYLVVELVRGVTLRQLLRDQGASLPTELAAEIVAEVGNALEHAHANGVIHRDVKPENVLLEPPPPSGRGNTEDVERPRVKLTDFGIAKLLDVEGITSTGQVLGSPAHMAPEQIEGRVVDARADVFSLGVLFYECLTGQLPFAGKNPAQVLRNVLEGNFRPADLVEPKVGPRWSRLLTKALQREPEQRYETLSAFVNAIRAELHRLGFDRPRQDIAEFLADPAVYRAQFNERIVSRLRDSAAGARQRRDMAAASADYCRALVYRPGDANLLAAVSTLRTRHWMKWSAWGVAVTAIGVLALGGVWMGGSKAVEQQSLAASSHSALPVAEAPAPDRETQRLPVTPTGAPTAVRPAPATDPAPKVNRPRTGKPTAAASEETPGTADGAPTRRLSIRITGASGGSVKIDGRPVQWFGQVNEVTVGPHLFEFLPPNESCCLATKRQVDVPAGDGVFVVMGSVPFKDAVFVAKTPEGEDWTVSCPTLFSGSLSGSGRRSIPLTQVEVTGSCLISDPSGVNAGRKSITLRAGQTSTLSWP
jgi:tRNA A-37 threonylcarbamoyl transferase component Bud32